MQIMKKTIVVIAIMLAAVVTASAGDRPVTFTQLPVAAQTFVTSNFPDVKVSYATVDDDFIRPDYNVVLADGTKIQFDHSGSLEKVETKGGVPAGIVPVQITDFVRLHYPDAAVIEYEIGRRSYDVKLSNRMELTFNKNWNLVEIDD